MRCTCRADCLPYVGQLPHLFEAHELATTLISSSKNKMVAATKRLNFVSFMLLKFWLVIIRFESVWPR